MSVLDFSINTLISAAPVMGLFLASFVIFSDRKKIPGIFSISLFLLIFSLILVWNEFSTTVLDNEYPLFIRLMGPFLTLMGPGVYFSIRSMLDAEFRHRWFDFLHFIPFLFYFLHLVAFYLHDAGMLAENTENIWMLSGLWLGLLIHFLCYFILVMRMLRRYSIRLKQIFSNTEKYDLSWIIPVMVGFLVLNILSGVLLGGVFHRHLTMRQLNRLFSLAFSIGIYYSAMKILIQRKGPKALPPLENRKENDNLQNEEREQLYEEILNVMAERKPFLEPELSLPQLAADCSLTTHKLSEVLNGSGTIFYDFINRYRVDEFCRLLDQPDSDRYTLLALAMDAGFSSKTTFNTVFKKIKGLTPSQYRKQRTESLKD